MKRQYGSNIIWTLGIQNVEHVAFDITDPKQHLHSSMQPTILQDNMKIAKIQTHLNWDLAVQATFKFRTFKRQSQA